MHDCWFVVSVTNKLAFSVTIRMQTWDSGVIVLVKEEDGDDDDDDDDD